MIIFSLIKGILSLFVGVCKATGSACAGVGLGIAAATTKEEEKPKPKKKAGKNNN